MIIKFALKHDFQYGVKKEGLELNEWDISASSLS
jgi:hypothetical protein